MEIGINRETIESRLSDLDKSIKKLRILKNLNFIEFSKEDNFALASFHLLRAIEDILSIGTHILSRTPGSDSISEYRKILPELAKAGIISEKFAKRNAGLGNYRNRLVHHYLKITPNEFYNEILGKHIKDLEGFGKIINNILNNPGKFGVKVS